MAHLPLLLGWAVLHGSTAASPAIPAAHEAGGGVSRHCRRCCVTRRAAVACEVSTGFDLQPACPPAALLLTKAEVAGHAAIQVGRGGDTRLPQRPGGGLHGHCRPAGLQQGRGCRHSARWAGSGWAAADQLGAAVL